MEEKQYYTMDELAKLFSVNKATVRKWIYDEKVIEAVKIGKVIRIHKDELKKLRGWFYGN